MAIGIHVNLLSKIITKIQQEQVQLSYDMKMATPGVFHPEAAYDREIEPVYNPIACGRTRCRLEHQELEVPGDLERCR